MEECKLGMKSGACRGTLVMPTSRLCCRGVQWSMQGVSGAAYLKAVLQGCAVEQEGAAEGGQVGVGEVDLVHQVSQSGGRRRALEHTAAGGGPLHGAREVANTLYIHVGGIQK